MRINYRLAASSLPAIAVLAVAFMLHERGPFFDGPGRAVGISPDGLLVRETGLNLNYVSWPLAGAAMLSLLGRAASWLRAEGTRSWLLGRIGLREAAARPAPGWVDPVLQTVGRLSGSLAWLVLCLGALLAVPKIPTTISHLPLDLDLEGVRPYLGIFADLAPWAFLVLASITLLRLAAAAVPSIGAIVPVPYIRLSALGVSYIVLAEHGVLDTAFNAHSLQLLAAVAAALGLSYSSTVLRRIVSQGAGADSSKVNPAWIAGGAELGAVVLAAFAGAVFTWGLLNSLPVLSAALLDHWSTYYFGEASLFHFGQLFDSRFLLAVPVMALGLTAGLPKSPKFQRVASYRPLAVAVGLSVSGCVCWIAGARFAPLGHGYLLIGATAAAGLFSAALSQLAHYATSAPSKLMADLARWMSGSAARGFLLGASIAVYGLVVRPVFYEMLRFAPVFEWLVIITVATVSLNRITNRAKVVAEATPVQPTAWTEWGRHGQTIEELPDLRFEEMLDIHRKFGSSGEWRPIWTYLLELMYLNGVSPDEVPVVFEPMRRGFASSTRRRRWYDKLLPLNRRREAALSETLRRVEVALSRAPAAPGAIDEPTLRAVGERFVAEGEEPDHLAAVLASAYWQHGGSLTQAVELWFPLMIHQEAALRWFHLPRARAGVRLRNEERRRRIVDGAIAHLLEQGDHRCLPVAISAEDVLLYSKRTGEGPGAVRGTLRRGQGVEVLEEGQSSLRVRTTDAVEGYMLADELVRQPLLPRDCK